MVQWSTPDTLAISQPLPVSPRGFKSSLEIVVKALIQLELPATVLAKLPSGSSWLEDLKGYYQAVGPAVDIYLLTQRSLPEADWFTAVSVPNTYSLKGEYRLLVVAKSVGLMVLGHRQEASPSVSRERTSPSPVQGEDIEGSPKVNLSITLQPALLNQALATLRQILQSSLKENPHQPVLQSLINQWEERLRLPDQTHPALLETLLMQQSHHQEHLRQQVRQYRGQAMTASNLSSQNEALVNNLRLKDNFVNTVGQELRTPLSTIKTALPLLSSPNLKPTQRQRYLAMISRECDRQSRLINGVLDLLQLERSFATATPEAVSLFDVVPGVVSTYQPIAQEKGIRLAYTVPDTLPLVYCPESWVRQIVIHLLNNSIRHTEAGGEVWVTVQAEADGSIALNVKDSGIGIPPNELPRVFDHFFRGRQTSNDDEGAGLGLTIVQQLLLYCGGHIEVESQPKAGTHFKVKLPVDPR